MARTRTWGALAMVAAVAGLAACDSGGGTEPDPTVEVVVTVEADGDGLSGVTTELFALGGTTALATATTDGNGSVRFGDLEEGTYEVEITVPEGYVVSGDGPTRQTVQATTSQDGTATFDLESLDTGPSVVEIHLTTGLTFSPAQVTVAPGTTVRWINDAAIFHTITPNGHSEWTRATLSASGEMFSHTFETVGEFPYFCEPHQSQGMTGTVTVSAASRTGSPAGR